MTHLLLLFLLLGGETSDQHGTAYDPTKPGAGLTVLDFAASWCKPCWKALPHVQAFAKANPDLRVLVISQDKEVKGRDRLIGKLKLTLPVIWDEGHRWAERYQPQGMPTTMIVNETGKILYQHVGFSDGKWAQFEQRLRQLQKE